MPYKTLPTGQISLSDVNVELKRPATQQIDLNDADVRRLAKVPGGQIAMSDLWGKSNAPTYIGQPYGGGFYAGKISYSGNASPTHYLIVSPVAEGQRGGVVWQAFNGNTPGTDGEVDGFACSEAMNDGNHPAAQFCRSLNIGGYTDWYLPAFYELNVLYYFLKPSGSGNTQIGFNGANPYAVAPQPYNTAYAPGSPGQTTAPGFAQGEAQAMAVGNYWSSTQDGANTSPLYSFTTGNALSQGKTAGAIVRAIRRMPV